MRFGRLPRICWHYKRACYFCLAVRAVYLWAFGIDMAKQAARYRVPSAEPIPLLPDRGETIWGPDGRLIRRIKNPPRPKPRG